MMIVLASEAGTAIPFFSLHTGLDADVMTFVFVNIPN